MIDFSNFYQLIAKSPLSHWLETLPAQVAAWQPDALHGKFREWERAVEFLPELTPWRLDLLHSVTAEAKRRSAKAISGGSKICLKPDAVAQRPLFAVRHQYRYRMAIRLEMGRVLPHLSDLTGRTILDVGCGSGYHMWRMIGAGAHLAVGIDPTQLFLCQFEAVRGCSVTTSGRICCRWASSSCRRWRPSTPCSRWGALPPPLAAGPSVAAERSAGARGELVLETLVVEGDENTVLVPGDRYAQMRNVYFIPSAAALKMWLEKCGFIDVRIVDASSPRQRSSDAPNG